MIPYLLLARIALASVPLDAELCGTSNFSVEVQSAPFPWEEEGIRFASQEGKRAVSEAVLFEGQVLRLSISGQRWRTARALPVSVSIKISGQTTVSAVREVGDWTPTGPPDQSGRGRFAATLSLSLPPLATGSYELSVAPVGCGPEYRHHYQRVVRLKVRPVRSADDRAALEMVAARRLAYFDNKCEEAIPIVASAERKTAVFKIEVLRMRAVCAFRGGRLDEAIRGYEALQFALEQDPAWQSHDGGHREDYRNKIVEIRKQQAESLAH